MGVSDIGNAYLKLFYDFPRVNFDIFNICSGEARSLRELLILLCKITKTDKRLLNFGSRDMRVGGPPISYGDNNKARLVLDWHPHSLDETLKTL